MDKTGSAKSRLIRPRLQTTLTALETSAETVKLALEESVRQIELAEKQEAEAIIKAVGERVS